MTDTLKYVPFSEITLANSFFDSLKSDYREFSEWYDAKCSTNEKTYVQYTNDALTGFMYLKQENGVVLDITPNLPDEKRIKIGTLKVDAHGTRLGERLIKKAFDFAISKQANEIYVTIFPRHESLIRVLGIFGFEEYGEKTTANGTEKVFIKYLSATHLTGNIIKDYPLIKGIENNYYLLSINPSYHTKLFPDSILRTENYNLIDDTSPSNSIFKTYICNMRNLPDINTGDILVMYRTKEETIAAEYSAVATSICTVQEFKRKGDFHNQQEYINYTQTLSVLTERELASRWHKTPDLSVIKMLYNAAFTKKLIRKTLADDIGLNRDVYWGFLKLSKPQFQKIIELGGLDGRSIIY